MSLKTLHKIFSLFNFKHVDVETSLDAKGEPKMDLPNPVNLEITNLRYRDFEIEYGRHVEGLYGVETRDSYRRNNYFKGDLGFYK